MPPPPDTYFLTEAVLLHTQGPFADDSDEGSSDGHEGNRIESTSKIIPTIEQYGIMLKYGDYAHPQAGNFKPELYTKWIEARLEFCKDRGWLAKDILKYGGDMKILFGKGLNNIPIQIMDLIKKSTGSPTTTHLDELIIDKKIAGLIKPVIEIPFISWLNQVELNQVSARLNELFPQKINPAIKPLWEFTDLARQIIEGWYIHNTQEIPKIEYPGIKLSEMDKCYEIFKQAATCGPQTPEQLQEWKQRFSIFPDNYMTRCAERYVERIGPVTMGPGSGNGLEWRRQVWP